MKPSQVNLDKYHPEGPLFILDPRDKFAVPILKSYIKFLQTKASQLERSKSLNVKIKDDKPISYWLKKKINKTKITLKALEKWQSRNQEKLKWPD